MASTPPTTPRRRLTRDEQREETRERLLEAAERLFARRGIAETPIEEIAESAGYSRGAFYSNFADREALVLALLERHLTRSMSEVGELDDQGSSAPEFLERVFERELEQSVDRATIGIEYILYAIRNPASRPKVRALNNRLLEQQRALVAKQYEQLGVAPPFSVDLAAKILLGLDEGFALLRLIDPEGFPVGMWGDSIRMLNEAALALAEKRARESSP